MADKTHNDAESFAVPSHEEKRKKRMKWAIYISAFAVFQVVVILVFVLVIMKVRTPKFRVGTFEIQSLNTPQTSSFSMSFVAPIRIKNNNFGPYKYDATTVNFTYRGAQVGHAAIPKSKANFMGTKKIDANVTLSSADLPSSLNSTLSSDLSAGALTLMSEATLHGKSEVMIIFKKKKSTTMNCTMIIDVTPKTLRSVTCK